MRRGAIHVLESILGAMIILSVLSILSEHTQYFHYNFAVYNKKNIELKRLHLIGDGSLNISPSSYYVDLIFGKEYRIFNKSNIQLNINYDNNNINIVSDNTYCNITYNCESYCNVYIIYKNKSVEKFYPIEYTDGAFYGTY